MFLYDEIVIVNLGKRQQIKEKKFVHLSLKLRIHCN